MDGYAVQVSPEFVRLHTEIKDTAYAVSWWPPYTLYGDREVLVTADGRLAALARRLADAARAEELLHALLDKRVTYKEVRDALDALRVG